MTKGHTSDLSQEKYVGEPVKLLGPGGNAVLYTPAFHVSTLHLGHNAGCNPGL